MLIAKDMNSVYFITVWSGPSLSAKKSWVLYNASKQCKDPDNQGLPCPFTEPFNTAEYINAQ